MEMDSEICFRFPRLNRGATLAVLDDLV